MSDSKFTPGPWFVNIERVDGHIIECTVKGKALKGSDTLYDIAKMFNMGHPEIAASNARIMASGPELLDALERAIAYFDPASQTFEQDSMSAIIDQCRYIIEKAKGE